MRRCGCGVIASMDLLIYLCRYHGCVVAPIHKLVRTDPIPLDEYDRCALQLSRRYLPLIPGHGINGLMLALGINRVFSHYGMPYKARWGAYGEKFWLEIARMLRDDFPVILSIGPNFPFFWQHNTLPFYAKKADGVYTAVTKANAHYVSVTGLDENWLRISSWGREYYISRSEYESYVKRHSLHLVSNILIVKPSKL